MRRDESDEPDQPGDRDRGGGDEARECQQDRAFAADVDTHVGGRLFAQEEPVEHAGPSDDRDRSADDQRRRERKPEPARAFHPAQQEGEDLAQVRAGKEHRHRQARRQQRAHRVARQEEPRQRRERSAAAPQPVDQRHRRERPREREDVEQSKVQERGAERDQDGDGRAKGRAGRGPQHVRVGQRVAQETLERRPGDRQPAADHDRGQDARQAQLQDDRLGRRRPRPIDRQAHGPEQDPQGVAGGNRDRSGRHRDDDGQREHADASHRERGRARRPRRSPDVGPGQGEAPPPDAHRAEPGAG